MNTRTCYGEQNVPTGELDSMSALVSNITPSDIPLAQNIDIEELKQADDDPLEIVVEIPVGKSKRNWNYTAKSLKDIVDYTMKNTLNGFLGHQKAEDVSSEFKVPVTHWIGAEMKGNSAFFRGLIDADATSLKRWIRTGRIKEVSIFGYPDLKNNSSTGEMDVVGYDPLSIDWTPLHRPGMPTKIVGMEMKEGKEGDENIMTYDEIISALKKMIKDEEVTLEKVAEALSIKVKKEDPKAKAISQEMDEVKTLLGATGEMDILSKVKELLNKDNEIELEAKIDKAIKEKVQGEMAQDLVKEMLKLDLGATDEAISGEIARVLENDNIKALLSNKHIDMGVGTGMGSDKGNDSNFVTVKKSRI